jgi:hypothetical protein
MKNQTNIFSYLTKKLSKVKLNTAKESDVDPGNYFVSYN